MSKSWIKKNVRARKLIYRLQKMAHEQEGTHANTRPSCCMRVNMQEHTHTHTHTLSRLYLEGWYMIGNKCKASSEKKKVGSFGSHCKQQSTTEPWIWKSHCSPREQSQCCLITLNIKQIQFHPDATWSCRINFLACYSQKNNHRQRDQAGASLKNGTLNILTSVNITVINISARKEAAEKARQSATRPILHISCL